MSFGSGRGRSGSQRELFAIQIIPVENPVVHQQGADRPVGDLEIARHILLTVVFLMWI
jgi:hypothetical protein